MPLSQQRRQQMDEVLRGRGTASPSRGQGSSLDSQRRQQMDAVLSQRPVSREKFVPQEDFGTRFAKGLVKPAVDFGKFAFDAAALGLRSLTPEYRQLKDTVGSGKASVEQAQRFGDLNQPIFNKTEDLSRENIAKTTLWIASIVLPVNE